MVKLIKRPKKPTRIVRTFWTDPSWVPTKQLKETKDSGLPFRSSKRRGRKLVVVYARKAL